MSKVSVFFLFEIISNDWQKMSVVTENTIWRVPLVDEWKLHLKLISLSNLIFLFVYYFIYIIQYLNICTIKYRLNLIVSIDKIKSWPMHEWISLSTPLNMWTMAVGQIFNYELVRWKITFRHICRWWRSWKVQRRDRYYKIAVFSE